MNESDRGKQYHENMVKQIAKGFSDLTEGQRRYIQNKTSNILRSLGDDIWGVWITREPINPAQYCQHAKFIVADDVTVYVTIQVDYNMTLEQMIEKARKRRSPEEQAEIDKAVTDRMKALDLKLSREFKQSIPSQELLNKVISL